MRYALSLRAAALAVTVAATVGACVPLEDSPLMAKVQDHLDALEAAGITGVLAEVDVDDERALARSGRADTDGAAPVPWDARFRMGSATKTFVAVVMLQLVAQGRVSLDDSVDTWLPGVVAGNGLDATRITIRDLLQHTSGIYNYTIDFFSTITPERYAEHRLDHHEPVDLVAIATRHPPDFAPGAAWSYSNTNYVLAGMIIERATGRDWRDEVRARILAPLELRLTTDPGDDPDLPGPHARGYEQFVDGGALVDVTLQNQTFADAAGSLVTTTDDLARFWRALRTGELLGPAEMAEMERTVLATPLQEVFPGLRYGLGVMAFPSRCGETLWTHFGDTLGYSTRSAISGDGARSIVVSLSTNRAGEAALEVFAEEQRLLEDVVCDGRD